MTALVPGIPPNYELVRIGIPQKGESYIDAEGMLSDGSGCRKVHPVVRPIPVPLELRVGSWYERRDGKVVGPCVKIPAESYPWGIGHNGYTRSGHYWVSKTECPIDLIREVPPPEPEPTKWIVTPTEPSPGEGWRWVEPTEEVKIGDEFICGDGKWLPHIAGRANARYRRRIEPPQPSYADRQAAWVKEHGIVVGSELKSTWSGSHYIVKGIDVDCLQVVYKDYQSAPGSRIEFDSFEPIVPQYRPFANLAEWWPNRNFWTERKDGCVSLIFPGEDTDWNLVFSQYKFIHDIQPDGTFQTSPFGVRVDE